MSVIIRLQGLPWTANALDIRQYFNGLTIPEGGVHIVGGDDGDAFIAFSSDEDARQAMLMDGGRIKETSKVKLMLSSRAEMQKVIDAARNRNLVMQGLLAAAAASASTVSVPMIPSSSISTNQQLQMELQMPLVSAGAAAIGASSSTTATAASASSSAAVKQAAAAELSMQQQLFMNRAAAAAAAAMMPGHQMQTQPFHLQQLKFSTMEMLQGDMRQLMMQNMGLQSGVVVGSQQSMLPNSANMGMGNVPAMTSPSYEPTKKLTAPSDQQQQQQRSDRDRDLPRERDRDREQRDRSGGDNNNSRRWNRNDRRSSRSPRRRSRDRDRDGGSSRRRDRRRSVSRGRSREKSNDRTRTRSSAIDPFVSDVDNRRRANTSTADNGPIHTVNGVQVQVSPALPSPSSNDNRRDNMQSSNQRSSRWSDGGVSASAEVIDLEANDNLNMRDRMQQQQLDKGGEMMPWGRDVVQSRSPQLLRDDIGPLPPRQNGPFNARPEPRSSLCIVMRGIPFDTHPLSIRDYFHGLNIPPDGVRLLIDRIGNRPHLAFVRFANEFDRDIVLKRQSHYFQGLMVEVLPSSEEEFLRIPPQPMGGGGGGGGGAMGGDIEVWSRGNPQRHHYNQMLEDESCVFVKGIPFKCTEKDVFEFFDGFRIVDALVEYLRPGKSAGTAFAEFCSPLEAQRALELDGQKMDFRNVELRLSTKESMMTARRQTNENVNGRMQNERSAFMDCPPPLPPPAMPMPIMMSNDGFVARFDCCLITGLPLNATDRDILDFFAPADIAPMVIHVMLDTASRPMGDAFCEFASPRECQLAVQMDGLPLRPPQGKNAPFVLSIRPVSRMELDAALGAISMGGPPPPPKAALVAGSSDSGKRSNGSGPLNSASFATPNKQSPNINKPNIGSGGGPLGAVPTGGANNGVVAQPQSPRVPSTPTPKSAASAGGTVTQSSPVKQVTSNPVMQQRQQQPKGGVPSFFGRPSAPGCILEVQNLPFLSTSEDILQHFKGFGLTKESIMRRFRENGAPTGDARLLFRNPKDTQVAYRQLNSVMMCGRVLNLKILA